MPSTITKTVKPSGGDYSSLLAFEAGEQGDLPTLDQIKQAECYNFEDTAGEVTFDGWTTDASRYIRVYTPQAERHKGKPGFGYRHQGQTIGLADLDILENFVRVEGIAFTNIDSSTKADAAFGFDTTISGASDIRISQCFTNASYWDGKFARIRAFLALLKIWNCIMYMSHIAWNFADAAANFYFYNNTIRYENMGDFTGLMVGESSNPGLTVALKNMLCDRGANPSQFASCYLINGAATTGSTNNLSDDGTAPGGNPITNVNPIYKDRVNSDLHLADADRAARNAGADLSADSNLPFSDDIDGDSRPIGAAWDVGADEAPPPPPPSLGALNSMWW